jgi:hypothetical protein
MVGSKSIDLDAYLKGVKYLITDLDAVLRLTKSTDVNLDAVITAEFLDLLVSLDAILQVAGSRRSCPSNTLYPGETLYPGLTCSEIIHTYINIDALLQVAGSPTRTIYSYEGNVFSKDCIRTIHSSGY